MLTAIVFKNLVQKCLIARTGIAMYKRALDLGPFNALTRSHATAFERQNDLMTTAAPQWGTCNALVFNSAIFERLIDARMNGTDQMSKLVDATLQAGVAGAPR